MSGRTTKSNELVPKGFKGLFGIVLVTCWDTFGTMFGLLFGLFLATMSDSLALFAALVGMLHFLMIRATKQQVKKN